MGVPAQQARRAARAGRGRLPARPRAGRRRWHARLAAAVAAHDAADPVDPGLPLEAARRALDLPDARLVEVVLRHGARRPRRRGRRALTLRDGRVAAARAAPGCPRPCARLWTSCAPTCSAPRSTPPRPPGSPSSGWARASSRRWSAAGSCCASPTAWCCCPAPTTGRSRCSPRSGPEFTLSAARQALGTTRRVAVPLLELLARTGRTERTADGGHRLVRPAPAERRIARPRSAVRRSPGAIGGRWPPGGSRGVGALR